MKFEVFMQYSNKTKQILLFLILLCFLSTTSTSLALSQERLADKVKSYELDNGLKVLLVERRSVPVISCRIAYKSGSVYEHAGISGVAHLLEHLAFNGTKKIGTLNYKKEKKILQKLESTYGKLKLLQKKGVAGKELIDMQQKFDALVEEAESLTTPNELAERYQRNGAAGLNAFTGKDTTTYTVSLPSNKLGLWAEIESDRMENAVLRKFYTEKEVVLEERRLRVDNSPTGYAYEKLFLTAFEQHPYRLPTIGFESDIKNLTAKDAENFLKKYYGPNNAVIAIVGDIDTDKTFTLIKEKFGHIPRSDDAYPVHLVEPAQTGEKRLDITFESEPFLLIAYHKPGTNHRDDYVFDLIQAILSNGRTARLYKELVTKTAKAVSIGATSSMPASRYPNLFVITAVPLSPVTSEELENLIYKELDRLKASPITKIELNKVQNQIEAGLVRSLRSNSGLANRLAHLEAVAGDWNYLEKARKIWKSITPEEIMQVARKYFRKANRTVITVSRL